MRNVIGKGPVIHETLEEVMVCKIVRVEMVRVRVRVEVVRVEIVRVRW